jgi:hypothetical protein
MSASQGGVKCHASSPCETKLLISFCKKCGLREIFPLPGCAGGKKGREKVDMQAVDE